METNADKYFDPEEPGSFTSLTKFKRNHPETDTAELGKLLSGYRSYTLHKAVRRRFPRNRTLSSGIDKIWQIDLSDMSKYATFNDGSRFLMVAIDIFSRKLFVTPIKSKFGASIVEGFKKIFSETDRRPKAIQADQGTEFSNKIVQSFLRAQNIKFYTTFNQETKAALVERVQRTIKEKLWRYFTHENTSYYLDVLPKLVSSYNNTYHQSIKTPNNVTKTNEREIRSVLYGDLKQKRVTFKLEIGDTVRIATHRMIFRKGYESGWSEELFKIKERVLRHPPVYILEDLNREPLKGSFYEYELQKVRMRDDLFIVNKILRRRKKNGKLQYLVSWLGYPDSFNSWVDNLEDI